MIKKETNYNIQQNVSEKLAVFDNRRKNNLPLTIDDLNVLLEANWDFSFKYKNETFEIIHDKDLICLYKINKQNGKLCNKFKTNNELVNSKILNKPFLEIWENSEYI